VTVELGDAAIVLTVLAVCGSEGTAPALEDVEPMGMRDPAATGQIVVYTNLVSILRAPMVQLVFAGGQL
jgi:hypothetical protein